jgi:thymidine kinase
MGDLASPTLVPLDVDDGGIDLVSGPMFAGKTTHLVTSLAHYIDLLGSDACLVIKHNGDTRFSTCEVVTHDGKHMEAIAVPRLAMVDVPPAVRVIGIDEGQLFEDLYDFCVQQEAAGRVVVVAALSATSERTPMGQTLQLIPVAARVTFLTAPCALCYAPGAFTKCLVPKTDTVLIGGAKEYQARCLPCYLKATPSHEKSVSGAGLPLKAALHPSPKVSDLHAALLAPCAALVCMHRIAITAT